MSRKILVFLFSLFLVFAGFVIGGIFMKNKKEDKYNNKNIIIKNIQNTEKDILKEDKKQSFEYEVDSKNKEKVNKDESNLVIKHDEVQYKNIEGVDPNLLSLDVYYSENTNISTKSPVMIWVHGGGWQLGDKANNMKYKVPFFLKSGWVLVSVNYRLSPKLIYSYGKLKSNRVKYPDHENDVADAIFWVYKNIYKYNGDPNNISLMGHSAGGGIVSTIATNDEFLKKYNLDLSLIKNVVSLDTQAYDVRKRIEGDDKKMSKVYINAFGNNPKIWDKASPIDNITKEKTIPRFFIVTRGSEERVGLSELFASKLESVGVEVKLIYTQKYSHEQVNTAIGNPSDKLITPTLKRFLNISD